MNKVPAIWPSAKSQLGGEVMSTDQEASEAAREVFYTALQEEAPDAVEDLRQACMTARQSPDTSYLEFVTPESLPMIEQIRPTVTDWAQRFHIHAPWMIDEAIWAFIGAEKNSPGEPGPLEFGVILGPRPEEETHLIEGGTVEVTYIWPVGLVSRTATREYALAEFERKLDASLDRIEAEVRMKGVQALDLRKIERHMRWLVHRVVYLESPERIAKRAGELRTPRAIREALKSAGTLIGLPLPPLSVGRPRKPRARVVKLSGPGTG